MNLKGIDVSNHNGNIVWNRTNNDIDFAMIRGGYSLTKDARFDANIKACNQLGIPCGVYWFSYALSKDGVLNEAKKCVDTLRGYKVDFPVAFDWEYDSDEYYKKSTGYTLGNDLRAEFATIFLDYIKSQGYIPMLYSNVDYIDNKGFKKIKDKYDLWLAHWGAKTPRYDCAIWQKSSTEYVAGIEGYVDYNVAYKKYASEKIEEQIKDDKAKLLEAIKNSYYEKYYTIAQDILRGTYGNGETRKAKLKEKNIDYDFAQAIVNVLVS